jgi:hypothetical protein
VVTALRERKKPLADFDLFTKDLTMIMSTSSSMHMVEQQEQLAGQGAVAWAGSSSTGTLLLVS